MISVDELPVLLPAITIIKSTERTKKGYFQLETKFVYPDGSPIKVFLVERFGKYILTDLGQSVIWLLQNHVSLFLSPNRKKLFSKVATLHGVVERAGNIELALEDLSNLSDKVFIMGQACIRMSDFIYTYRVAFNKKSPFI